MTTTPQRIGELQARQQRDELRTALRALLMRPLMAPEHENFAAVRRHAETLREWFAREAGWPLHVERDGARLAKRPADLDDATRGLTDFDRRDFDRRRYVVLCLTCAALERADAQISLHLLADRVMALAAEPALESRGFTFTLQSAAERRELVAVCRLLLDLGVLQRVAGGEEGFADDPGAPDGSGGPPRSDALYDIRRRLLAGLLAAVRGPSTWTAEEAPVAFDDRLRSLVAEPVPDSDEGRRTALRHHLARRLLDDPVVYTAGLDGETQAYFANQRGAMAARLCEATGLTAEQRAEGLALTDEGGALTDVAMPSEGTDAHVTLLVAEHLAQRARAEGPAAATTEAAVAAFLRDAADRYGRFWRKSARLPGAEHELARIALDRLEGLRLVTRDGERVRPLPAIARFALGSTDLRSAPARGSAGLFGTS